MTTNDGSSQDDSLARVDWKKAEATMRRVITANVGNAGRDDIDDLVQESQVGLMRTVQRGEVENVEAMAVTIAKRKAINWIRRPKRVYEDLNSGPGEIAAPTEDRDGLAPEEIQFYVRELILCLSLVCKELFESWFRSLNLADVARELGVSHANARQRKGRCVNSLRDVLLADDGPLGEWAREMLGARP